MLKHPNFALNPAHTLAARDGGFLSVHLWWIDRDGNEPVCEISIDGVGVAGLHFPTDDELWVLTADGELAAWPVAELIAHAESVAAAASIETDVAPADDGEGEQEADPVETKTAEDPEAGPSDDADAAAADAEPEPSVQGGRVANAAPTPRWKLRLDADIVATAGDGKMFAAGDSKGRVWLIERHGETAHVRLGTDQHSDAVMALAFSRGALSLASSGRDRVVRIWRSADAEGLNEASLVSASEVMSFMVEPQEPPDDAGEAEEEEAEAAEEEAAEEEASAEEEETTEESGEAKADEPPKQEQAQTGPRPAALRLDRVLVGIEGWQLAVAFSGDGRYLASGGMDQGLYVWDLAVEDNHPSAVQFAHSGWVVDVAWSDDNRAIATASWDNTIGLFEGSSLEPLVCFQLHRDYVSDVEFAGSRLVAASHDREVSVWDWQARSLERVLTGHKDWVELVLVLGEGRLASVASDHTMRIWDLEDGRPVHVVGRADALDAFEVGAPVDLSAYVDVTGLASYGLDPRSPASGYRDYRATGFRSASEQTALGLLEGAMGAVDTTPVVPEDRAWAPAQLETDAVEATPVEAKVARPPRNEPAITSTPEPDETPARSEVAATPAPVGEPEPESANEADEANEANDADEAEPKPESEVDDESIEAETSETRDEPEVEPIEAAAPEQPPPAVEEEKPEPEPELEVPVRSEREKAELERKWRREPSIGTTTIRRMPPVGATDDDDRPLEASIGGASNFTSFDAVESFDVALTMGLGDEPSERFDVVEPGSPYESIADPPSTEVGALNIGEEVAAVSVDDGWEELEQKVDASIFQTHSWPKTQVEPEEQLASQTGEWEITFDGAAPPTLGTVIPPPGEVTAEIPANEIAELRARSDDVEQTQSARIWERLPSRVTSKSELLEQRAAVGASRFALSHKIKTPHEFVYGIAVSPDGRRIATCGGDNSMCVWGREGDLQHRVRVKADGLNALNFSFDGRAIAAGGDDQIVHLWLLPPNDDLSTTIEHAALRGHDGWISSVSFSPDGSFVLTGSYDGTARVWKLSSGQCVRTLTGHDGPVSGAAIGTSRAFTVGHDGGVRVWNQQWSQIDYLSGHDRLLGISTNGKIAAFCAANGEVSALRDGRAKPLLQHRGQARAVCVRGDGAIFSAGEDGTVRVYSAKADSPIQSLITPGPLWCVDARADVLVVGGDDGFVYIFTETTK